MALLGKKKQAVKILLLAGNRNCLQPAYANVSKGFLPGNPKWVVIYAA
jgi:hypothetical protein